jgi:hypothetical protein
VAHQLEQPPVIDGELSDPIWSQAQAVELTAQSYPEPGQPPSFSTRVRLLYDRKALYLAFECDDPEPQKIIERITNRDRLVESDWVRVELDSQGDRRTGFYFLLNAAGVKVDGTLFNEREESADWDGVWEGKTGVATQGQKGWTAEMRIPLALLRFSPGPEVLFGLQLTRRISRLNELDVWRFISPESGLRVSRFGELGPLALTQAPRRLELLPYALLKVNHDGQGWGIDSERDLTLGLDGRLGLGAGFQLTASFNPDFGQVEADPLLLNLSNTETYYQEKRPFFQEDVAIFRTPIQGDPQRVELFYTRRIGRSPRQPGALDSEQLARPAAIPRIFGAAKLAGTNSGRLSVGVLQAVTSEEDALFETRDPGTGQVLSQRLALAEPLTSFSLLRLKQSFWENSSVGMMAATVVSPTAGAAFTGMVDNELEFLDGSYALQAIAFVSLLSEERFAWQDDFTQRKLRQEGALGHSAQLKVWKKGGEHFAGGAGGVYRSPSLALNDMGYLDRPDIFVGYGWVEFHQLKPMGSITKVVSSLSAWGVNNTAGTSPTDGANLYAQVSFRNDWQLSANAEWDPVMCDDREVHTQRNVNNLSLCRSYQAWAGYLGLLTQPQQGLSSGAEVFARTTDYGQTISLRLPMSLGPANRFQLDIIPAYQRTTGSVRWMDTWNEGAVPRYLFGTQHNESYSVLVRGTVTFRPTLSLQLYAQLFEATIAYGQKWDQTMLGSGTIRVNELNQTSVDDHYSSTETDLNLSMVLRWEYLPGSVAYLTYTGVYATKSSAADFRFGPVFERVLDATATHALMLKVSYLWL